MIILDTKVLSELMNPKGAKFVIAWTDAQPSEIDVSSSLREQVSTEARPL